MALYYGVATRNSTWTRGLAAMLQINELQEGVGQFPEIGIEGHGELH